MPQGPLRRKQNGAAAGGEIGGNCRSLPAIVANPVDSGQIWFPTSPSRAPAVESFRLTQLAGRLGCAGGGHPLCSVRERRRFRVLEMTGDQGKGGGQAGASVKDSRQDRLKLALRENLKRRKSQARGREDVASEPGDASLEHDPEKCEAVFRKDHDQTKS
ncbi:hypothetical protein [Bradyrhizobium sp. CCBAU 51753]